MSSSRSHLHHSLPAPVVHAAFSAPQSKSHVLAGVQDAYWSDDEAEDAECPLCLEEMDISDLNFKPCICGYQICRFCWHHIKENLNKRCPACRRIYTDDAVEFKPIATQDHKRLTQQKKQRDRERKELEALGRRHLANVRVVQRNVVFVVGIGPRFAKEELIPTLRSNDYFGQYGKITKILLVKRNSPGGGGPVVGLYITYHRREDAARAIAAVDGSPSPGGGREVMRASYGTTKYCMAFLRGVACTDHSCMNLHEWGDENDCFTKEDLTTLKHTMKATESRTRVVSVKKGEEEGMFVFSLIDTKTLIYSLAGLPRAASWGQKGSNHSQSNPNGHSQSSNGATGSVRQSRRTGLTRSSRPTATALAVSNGESRPQPKSSADRKILQTSSRPATPSESGPQFTDLKQTKKDETRTPSQLLSSSVVPEPSTEVSGVLPASLDRPDSTRSPSVDLLPSSSNSSHVPLAPPGLPQPPALSAPPGLPAPPGISPASRPPRAETASPQTPLLASQTSYQMSNAARALLDDVKARRESASQGLSVVSPFPDFDRTLQTLSGEEGGGFSFNLDPKLADEAESTGQLPDFDLGSTVPFHGSYIDAFPALRQGSYLQTSSLAYSQTSQSAIYEPSSVRAVAISDRQPGAGSGYLGPFDPFAEQSVDPTLSSSVKSQHSPLDEERKVSRFGFARGRQSSTTTSSPHSVSPLNYAKDLHPFYQFPDEVSSANPWPPGAQDSHFLHHPTTLPQNQMPSTLTSGILSEAQLRSFIQSSQGKDSVASNANNLMRDVPGGTLPSAQPFNDPAIMSASFSTPLTEPTVLPVEYGPPPGLPVPQRLSSSPAVSQGRQTSIMMETRSNSVQGEPLSSYVRGGRTVYRVPCFLSAGFILSPMTRLPIADVELPYNADVLFGGLVPTAVSSPSPSVLSPEDFPALSSVTSDPSLASAQVSESEKAASSRSKGQRKTDLKLTRKVGNSEKAHEKLKTAEEKTGASVSEKTKASKEKDRSQTAAHSKLEKTRDGISNTALVVPQDVKKSSTDKVGLLSQKAVGSVPKKPGHRVKTADTSNLSKKQEQTPKISAKTAAVPTTSEPRRPEVAPQVPLLSKKPKKSKSVVKAVKTHKEDDAHEDSPSVDTPMFAADSASSENSRPHSVDRHEVPTPIHEILIQIDNMNPSMDLPNHPFFDMQKLIAPTKMPLEYGPLVHALSALSVGGGSFANSMPSGSIDNAVSSFQQLLETLTQTISDLLRLLPRTTWDDSSSFDGVLRDMLKGDDFLDEGEENAGKEDEVAALTLALERRARWMEVQLSKLEELHRDINTAAVRAVLSFNDSGWDRYGFLPRVGNTLRRFENIGLVEEQGGIRPMTADELEKKLLVAREAAIFAETEMREAMENIQGNNGLIWQ
ncbi:hypothetical protein CVT26_015324 [Gymnopilus dilepis]|uniref:RING-type domain-containing protein n=1 Tax=Gymnopilus dilepis TaxID=231916 RepID=A0A409WM37_9AGAR|nr:hypothetical protein CVT26_015324 [Gymnopilus dilepis]